MSEDAMNRLKDIIIKKEIAEKVASDYFEMLFKKEKEASEEYERIANKLEWISEHDFARQVREVAQQEKSHSVLFMSIAKSLRSRGLG